MPDWKRVNIDFPTTKLGQYIVPVKETFQDKNSEEFETVFGVTNISGITITGKQSSEDISKYIILDQNYFVYNPYRINVGSIGYNSTGVKGCVSPAYVIFRTKQGLDPDFLFQYLKSEFGNHLINWYGNHGGVRNSLKYKDLCQIDIPDINYDKQLEIMRKIHGFKSSINDFEKQIELHFVYIENLRKQIFQEAIEGKLTANWHKKHHKLISGDNRATKLLEKIKAEKATLVKEKKLKTENHLPVITDEEKPFQLPEGWVWCRLGEIGITQTGTTPSTSDRSNFGDYIPFIKPADISLKSIDYSNEGLSKKGVSSGRLVQKNSILMVCIGGSIGKSYCTDQDVSFNQQINAITPLAEVSSLFLQFFLQSIYFQNEVWERAMKSSTPIINKSKWENIPIPLPPIKEQQIILEKITKIMAQLNELEKQVSERKEQSEMLMQSVLRDVFTAN